METKGMRGKGSPIVPLKALKQDPMDEACPSLCQDSCLWASENDLGLECLDCWDEVREEGSPMPCCSALMALFKRFHNSQ